MSKVRTLSRYFMKGHPRAAELTYFREKVIRSIGVEKMESIYLMNPNLPHELLTKFAIYPTDVDFIGQFKPKHHTIRMDRHFKPVDELTLAVWSGKPYRSKQIKLWAGKIKVVNIIICVNDFRMQILKDVGFFPPITISELAANDGLSKADFLNWFGEFKTGTHEAQILIWNPEITY